MQRRREKDRLLKLAVCSKICSAMQFITCPSETRGHWLTERRNMSESWSWNVLSPPHTLVLWSSEFYSQLWLLMRIWLKGTEQFKKKWYCENSRLVVLAVLTPPSPFASWAFPSRCWYSPPFPIGGWSACPILSVPISKQNTGQVPSSALFPPPAGMKRPAPGQDHVTWGQTPFRAHVSGAEGLFALLTREMDTRHWMHRAEPLLLPTRAAQRARTSCWDSDTNKESCAHKSLLQL